MPRTDFEKPANVHLKNLFYGLYLRRFEALASSKSNKKEAMDIAASRLPGAG